MRGPRSLRAFGLRNYLADGLLRTTLPSHRGQDRGQRAILRRLALGLGRGRRGPWGVGSPVPAPPSRSGQPTGDGHMGR